jgi:hypothetical protein
MDALADLVALCDQDETVRLEVLRGIRDALQGLEEQKQDE